MTATAHLSSDDLRQAVALMQESFADFTGDDWNHAVGGMHSVVHDEGRVVAHGSLVRRQLWTGERSLCCGYVEAVAVAPTHRRRGLATQVMTDLGGLAPGYEILALSASALAVPFYERLGWQRWRGPTSVISPTGLARTPGDDGSLYVHQTGFALEEIVDLDAPIACDWRDGDVW